VTGQSVALLDQELIRGKGMNGATALLMSSQVTGEQRVSERRAVGLSGRVVWKDARGTTRFNSVVIRDLSETGAYVENVSGSAIPLFRVVSLQAERAVGLPPTLSQGKVLSAVYRVGPSRPATGTPEGYALRLLIEPRRRAAARAPHPVMAFATA
jgi:hypothetical protein